MAHQNLIVQEACFRVTPFFINLILIASNSRAPGDENLQESSVLKLRRYIHDLNTDHTLLFFLRYFPCRQHVRYISLLTLRGLNDNLVAQMRQNYLICVYLYGRPFCGRFKVYDLSFSMVKMYRCVQCSTYP